MPTALLKSATSWLGRIPDTTTAFERLASTRWRQFLVLLLAGLILRGATFGNPNLHVDDSFYLLVALEMHDGALPYVDIWDRKPLGLFILYYLITCLPDPIIAYEIAAWLAAGVTAMIINRIARTWTNAQGGLLAGITYLVLLPLFEGWSGQSPVFYNAIVAGAALLVLRDRDRLRSGSAGWRTYAAMALGGIALTIKQMTFCEIAFLGLYAVWLLKPTDLRRAMQVMTWVALGVLPTAIIAATYYSLGHWAEYWQAMVTANLTKGALPVGGMLVNLLRISLRLYPILAMAVAGIALCERNQRPFLTGWLIASVLGMATIPNFYTHYALPLLVPLSVAAAFVLQRRDIGLFAAAATLCFSLVIYNPFNFAETRRSIASMETMAASIRKHDSGGGLFVADGPVGLYALSGKKPLSRIAFPSHLLEQIERDTIPIPADRVMDDILAQKPGVMVIAAEPSGIPTDGRTRSRTMAYARQNCRRVDRQISYEVVQTTPIDIYGDCRR